MNEIYCRLFDSGKLEYPCNSTSLRIGLDFDPKSRKPTYGSCYFMVRFGPLYIYSWTNHRWWLNLGAWLVRKQNGTRGIN